MYLKSRYDILLGRAGTEIIKFKPMSCGITSSVNSSTANLSKAPDPGYQFTGTAHSTLGVAGIQVQLTTDQDCAIIIEQSFDISSPWDIEETFRYYAGQTFSVTVQAINSYVRVRVINLSNTIATSYFNLQTYLYPVVSSME